MKFSYEARSFCHLKFLSHMVELKQAPLISGSNDTMDRFICTGIHDLKHYFGRSVKCL
jgi:hypothetical protein